MNNSLRHVAPPSWLQAPSSSWFCPLNMGLHPLNYPDFFIKGSTCLPLRSSSSLFPASRLLTADSLFIQYSLSVEADSVSDGIKFSRTSQVFCVSWGFTHKSHLSSDPLKPAQVPIPSFYPSRNRFSPGMGLKVPQEYLPLSKSFVFLCDMYNGRGEKLFLHHPSFTTCCYVWYKNLCFVSARGSLTFDM